MNADKRLRSASYDMATRSHHFAGNRQGVEQPGYRLGGRLNALYLHVGAYAAGVPQAGTGDLAYRVWDGVGWTGWQRLRDEQADEWEGAEE